MRDKVRIVATQLALKFSEESNIPRRFKTEKQRDSERKRERKQQKRNPNLNSNIEINFHETVKEWGEVIHRMLNKIDETTAWRFVSLKPIVEDNISNAVYAQDFRDFTDYLILRRNQERNDEEIGLLSMLHSEFQKEIEKKIQERQATTPVQGDLF